MRAGHGRTHDALRNANDVPGTNDAVAAETDGATARVENVIVPNDRAFAKTPRMSFGSAIVAAAARAADAVMVHVNARAVVVIKLHVAERNLLLPVKQRISAHHKVVIAAFRNAVVGDERVFRGMHAN